MDLEAQRRRPRRRVGLFAALVVDVGREPARDARPRAGALTPTNASPRWGLRRTDSGLPVSTGTTPTLTANDTVVLAVFGPGVRQSALPPVGGPTATLTV